MSHNRIFFAFASILLCIAAFILWIPSLVTPDLIQPLRVDSMYIEYQRNQMSHDQAANFSSIDSTIFFNPGDLGLIYKDFNVKTSDSLTLRGWMIEAEDSDANTILILHDWNESKILKLNLAKQMHDRGFNVCLIDLRAHGNSEGTFFSPGIVTVGDVKSMLDSLLKNPDTNHVAILGSGISAGIALQSAVYDGREDALVLQCPFNYFSKLVKQYAEKKWGRLQFIFYPLLQRNLEKMMLMPLRDLNLSSFSSVAETPTLFFAAGDDEFYSAVDAYSVYDSSAAEKKDLILVKQSNHENIEAMGGEQYYNAIAEFLNKVIPKKVIKTRNKKMT